MYFIASHTAVVVANACDLRNSFSIYLSADFRF